MTENAVTEIVEPPPQEVKVKAKQEPLALKDGVVSLTSVDQEYRLAGLYLKSRVLPDRFKTPEEIVVAMHFAREHFPDSTLTALRQIAIINGVPSFFGDLPLALVMKSGKLVSIEEFLVDENYQLLSWKNKNLNAEAYAAVCILKRSGQRQAREFFFSLDDAKNAGLYPCSNPSKPWAKYTRYMLKYRARSHALKDLFPDALNGVSIAEHDFDAKVLPNGNHDPKLIETNAAQELHEALMEDDHTITPV